MKTERNDLAAMFPHYFILDDLMEGHGERLPTGESGHYQRSDWLGRRVASVGDGSLLVDDPDEPQWRRGRGRPRRWRPPFTARGEHERNLQRFVTRYMNRLGPEHRETIEEAFYERATRVVMAERAGLETGSAITHRLETALRALIREMAADDVEYVTALEGRSNRQGLALAWFGKPYSDLTEDEQREYRRRYKAEVQRAHVRQTDEATRESAWRVYRAFLAEAVERQDAQSWGYRPRG